MTQDERGYLRLIDEISTDNLAIMEAGLFRSIPDFYNSIRMSPFQDMIKHCDMYSSRGEKHLFSPSERFRCKKRLFRKSMTASS